MTTPGSDDLSPAAHRRSVSLFNQSWDLMRLEGRTKAQDDELIHTVHASAYHWRKFGGTAANIAHGEN